MSILLGNCLYGNNISSCEEKDDIIVQISSILKEIDIEPVFLKSNKDIIWIRDIFVIIDNICFICNLTQRDTIGNNRTIYEMFDILSFYSFTSSPCRDNC